MSLPSRLQIGILVTAATLVVCFLGVRAELKSADSSIAEHRLRAQPVRQAARSNTAARDSLGADYAVRSTDRP
jgi:hypothetical protein